MKKISSLLKNLLFSPGAAAADSQRDASLKFPLLIYAAFLLGSMIFFWLKPWDFPDINAALPQESLSLGFWFKVMLWQPPLEAVWILLAAAWSVYFQKGNLGVRMAVGTLWTAAPLILIVFYAQKQGLPKPAFALGCAAAFGLFVPFLRRFPKKNWRPLASFMLGINVIGVALLVPMTISVLGRWPELFKFTQIAGGLWMLAAGTAGLRKLAGLRLPRAFMAVLFSMFLQIAFAFSVYFLGLVPKEILKALLYA